MLRFLGATSGILRRVSLPNDDVLEFQYTRPGWVPNPFGDPTSAVIG